MNTQSITKQDLTKDLLPVNEIFYSLQGEGPWQGEPAIFIRFSGCNIQCNWCDTKYTFGIKMSIHEILDEVKSLSTCSRIIITGGEPFIHNLIPLIDLLFYTGYNIQIETNGILSIPKFPWFKVTLVCSPKAGRIHKDIIFNCEHFKYVVSTDDLESSDGLPALTTQTAGKRPPPKPPELFSHSKTIWVMPLDSINRDNAGAAVEIALKHGYRFATRLHKTLGLK